MEHHTGRSEAREGPPVPQPETRTMLFELLVEGAKVNLNVIYLVDIAIFIFTETQAPEQMKLKRYSRS